jgi:Ca2+-binding RTX toxin-like protein
MVVKIGTFGNDLLIGSNAADSLQGSFGNDELRGLDGDDVLAGGGDHDTLKGGAGDDGLFGDGGNDTAVFSTASDVEVDLVAGVASSSGLGDDTLSSIENVRTGDGDDLVYGDEVANILTTGNGNDEVYAGDGNNIITTGAGNDSVVGGDDDDVIIGGGNADALYGGEGSDLIDGGNGNDLVDGFEGVDLLIGGGGADRFFFRLDDSGVGSGNRDEVTDFSQAQNDVIDLALFGSFSFIGESEFSAPDQIRFSHSGGDTIVGINTDGNAGAEMQIELSGIVNLTAGDFLL